MVGHGPLKPSILVRVQVPQQKISQYKCINYCMKNTFINDKFKKARGGYSRLLKISCRKCASFICNYQKDGPGNLRRMYMDRIFSPDVSIIRKDLSCINGHLLGVKTVYEKENRIAFRLFVDSVIKKIIKS